jgi:hypothetical protein
MIPGLPAGLSSCKGSAETTQKARPTCQSPTFLPASPAAISPGPGPSGHFRIALLDDPDGNTVVVGQTPLRGELGLAAVPECS